MIDRTSFEPLYLQVRRDIAASIESGIIHIGDKLMSEPEMQKHYGVGRVTIRAALADLVADGCIKKEHGRGTYCVSMPKREKRKAIDVLLNTADTYFIPFFLKGISQTLEANACDLLLHDTKDAQEHIETLLESILLKGTDGVILQPCTLYKTASEGVLSQLKRYQAAGIPFVLVDGRLPLDCVSMVVDDSHGGELAAKHLLDCGHRRLLGLFCESKSDAELRKAGLLKAVSKVDDAQAYFVDADENEPERLLDAIRRHDITAIQCYNDFIAVKCLRLLSEHGFRVPEDISVIGYDNTDLALSTTPQLTTITHPKSTLGRDAAQAILTMLCGAKPSQSQIIYQPELVVRQSVAFI